MCDGGSCIRFYPHIPHEYGNTFLCCYGLIGSHVVPISHSVLSGLDNGPHLNVKGPHVVNSSQKTEFSGARVSPTCSL